MSIIVSIVIILFMAVGICFGVGSIRKLKSAKSDFTSVISKILEDSEKNNLLVY